MMDYSGLPKDIVEKIASQHLQTFPDLLSFSCVCKSWRSAAVLLRCPPGLLVPETDAALAPLSPAAESRGQIHDFVSLTTSPPPPRPPSITLPLFPSPSKISDFHGQRHRYLRLHQDFLTTFPVIQAKANDEEDELFSHYDKKSDAHCLASKDGWILRTLPFHGDYHGRQLDLYLLNPFTGASIPLPPLKSQYADVRKAIISCSPDDDGDCYVFTLSNWQKDLLAWCKVGPGGGGWTFPPKNCLVRVQDDVPEDASSYGGSLYLASEEALWIVHDILKPFSPATGPTVRVFPFSKEMKSFDASSCCPPIATTIPHICHLSDGQVRLVLRDYGGDYHGNYLAFHVFKLAVEERSGGLDKLMNLHCGGDVDRGNYWEEVWSLDGHAVFIGAHQSISLPPDDHQAGAVVASTTSTSSVLNPNANNGIKGDHIYFAMNRVCWHHKSFREANFDGVFDLVNQKFQRFADEYYGDNKTRHPTFWLIPLPWGYSTKDRSKNQQKKKKKGKKKKKQITGAASSSQEIATAIST